MKKTNLFQRILAFVCAMVMLFGMMPMSALAVDPTADPAPAGPTKATLSAWIEWEKTQIEVQPDQSAGDDSWELMTTSEPEVQLVDGYCYTVKVKRDAEEQTAFTVLWGGNETANPLKTTAASVEATVSFDGLTLKLSCEVSDEESGETAAVKWGFDEAEGTLTLYHCENYDKQAVNPALTPVSGFTGDSDTTKNGKLQFTCGENSPFTVENGTLTATAEGVGSLVVDAVGAAGTYCYGTYTYSVNVKAASGVEITPEAAGGDWTDGEETGKWHNTQVTVTAYCYDGREGELPALSIGESTEPLDGEKKIVSVTLGGADGKYPDGEYSVKFDGTTKKVKVDTAPPDINDFNVTYSGDTTTVSAKVSDDLSGVAEVSVTYGEDKTEELSFDEVADEYKLTIEEKAENLILTAKDQASNKSDTSESPLLPLSVDITLPGEPGVDKGTKVGATYYYREAQTVTIAVSGVKEFDKLKGEVKLDGSPYPYSVEWKKGVNNTAEAEIPLYDGAKMSKLEVTVSEGNRSASKTAEGITYVVDMTAPTLTLSCDYDLVNIDGAVYIKVPYDGKEDNAEKTIVITGQINDDNFNPDCWTKDEAGVDLALDENGTFTITLTCKADEVVQLKSIGRFVDLAGNPLGGATIVRNSTNTIATRGNVVYTLSTDGGTVTTSIYVDRRPPESLGENDEYLGNIVLQAIGSSVTVDGKTLFRGDEDKYEVELRAAILDQGAGIAEVKWSCDGEKWSSGKSSADSENIYTYTVSFEGEEINGVTYYVKATDMAGNSRMASYTLYADGRAPEIEINMPQDAKNAEFNTVDGIDYFAAEQTIKVKVTDINLASAEIKYTMVDLNSNKESPETVNLTGESDGWTSAQNGVYQWTLTVGDGQKLTQIEVTATDNATNNTPESSSDAFVVDATNPTIKVTKREAKKTFFLKAETTYTVTIADTNLADGSYVKYRIAGSDGWTSVKLEGQKNADDKPVNTYVVEITLKGSNAANLKGDILTGVEIYAVDETGRTAERVEEEIDELAFTNEDGVFTFNADEVEVDDKAPVVEILMPQDAENAEFNTVDGIDYFAAEQTVTVKVTDINLDRAEIKYTMVDLNSNEESTENVNLTGESDGWTSAQNGVYQWTLTVGDGQKLTQIGVIATDKSTNNTTESSSDVFVVDATNPTITVTKREAKKTFFLMAETTYTVTIVDTNLSVDKGSTKAYSYVDYCINNNSSWDVAELKLKEGTLNTYVAEITLKGSNTANLKGDVLTDLEIYAVDKVQWTAETVNCDVDELKFTEKEGSDGKFIFNADEIEVDDKAPVVEVIMPGGGNKVDEIYYFDQEQNVVVQVTDVNFDDKIKDNKNAVTFNITDSTGNPVTREGISWVQSENDSSVWTYTIPVQSGEQFNSIEVIVYDKAGNSNDVVNVINPKSFVVDTTNPEITVTKREAKKTFFLKAETTYTVTIVDTNLSVDKGSTKAYSYVDYCINNNSSWDVAELKLKEGTLNTYVAEITLKGSNAANLRGDVLTDLEIYAVDKAGRTAERVEEEIEELAFNGEDGVFTFNADEIEVDDKAPAVEILMPQDAENAKYNTVDGIDYFAAEQTVTVEVAEVNLVSAEIVYTMVDLNSNKESLEIVNLTGESDGWTSAQNGVYQWELKVTDGQKLTSILVYAKDKVDHQSTENSDDVFVVDTIAPVVTVTFDNNNAINGKYYAEGRTATITVTDLNFDSGRSTPVITAMLDGATIATPSFGWGGNSGSVSFTTDGDYTMQGTVYDKAGNAVTFNVDPFTIDMTAPVIEFSGITNFSANSGAVSPVVSLTDVNLDSDGCETPVTFTAGLGENGRNVALGKSEAAINNGVKITFANIEKSPDTDGIYVLTANAIDLAGNESTDKITFSVNRYGSTYVAYDEITERLIQSGFSQTAPTIRVQEINPNKLLESSVVLSVAGKTSTLKVGTDYTVEKVTTGDDCWNGVVYTIDASLFQKDDKLIEGNYELTFYSKDKAENANSNRTNNNSLPIRFTLDNSVPVVSVVGVDNGDHIREVDREITVYYSDSSGISEVIIYLDGVEYIRLSGEELEKYPDSYSFTVDESVSDRKLSVSVIDGAGNSYEMDPITFFLNSSALRQFFRNTALVLGIGAGIVLVVIAIIFLVRRKRRTAVTE